MQDLATTLPAILGISMSLKPFLTARLPLPPGINHSYQIVRSRDGTRIADTAAARNFKEEAAIRLNMGAHDQAVIDAIRASRRKVPLTLIQHYYFPSLWKRDIDGGEKAVQDAVFKHLGLNDTLVVDKHTTKEESDDPRVEIEVRCFLSVNAK